MSSVICAGCGNTITAQFTKALNNIYHPNCFKCTKCGILLTGAFYEKDGKPYCEPDFDKFVDTCKRCKQVITTAVMKDDKQGAYHITCFTCYSCNEPLSTSFYYLNDEAYCQKCSLKTQYSLKIGIGVDKCSKCRKPIDSGDFITVSATRKLHTRCFTCDVCSKQISGNFSNHEDQYCCRNCLDTGRISVCQKCGLAIFGNKMSALNKIYHEDCFRCSSCYTLILPKAPFHPNKYQDPLCGLCHTLQTM